MIKSANVPQIDGKTQKKGHLLTPDPLLKFYRFLITAQSADEKKRVVFVSCTAAKI